MNRASPPWKGKVWPVLLVAVVVYVGFVSFADFSETIRHIDRVSGFRLAVVFALSFGSLALRAVRWGFFTRSIGVPLTVVETVLTFLSGVAMSITPGKVGEVVKCLLLKEAHGVEAARSAPLVIAERITDLIAVLVLGGVGLLALPGAALLGAGAMALAAVVLLLFVSRPAASAVIRIVARPAFMARHRDKITAVHDSLGQISAPAPVAVAMVLALGAWVLQGIVVYVLAGSFEGANISAQDAFLASNAPLLAGAIALVPGGLGAAEASMAGILKWTGGPGMTRSVAVLVTLLARVACFWFAILLGVAGLLAWRIRRRGSAELAGAPDASARSARGE